MRDGSTTAPVAYSAQETCGTKAHKGGSIDRDGPGVICDGHDINKLLQG